MRTLGMPNFYWVCTSVSTFAGILLPFEFRKPCIKGPRNLYNLTRVRLPASEIILRLRMRPSRASHTPGWMSLRSFHASPTARLNELPKLIHPEGATSLDFATRKESQEHFPAMRQTSAPALPGII